MAWHRLPPGTESEQPQGNWRPALSSQIPRFSLQPFADYAGAMLAIGRPRSWEAVVRHVVALDAERALDDLGGFVGSSLLMAWSSRLAMEYAFTLTLRQ